MSSRVGRWVFAVGLLLYLLVVLATSWAPGPRAWGFNLVGFLSHPAATLVLLLLFLGVVAAAVGLRETGSRPEAPDDTASAPRTRGIPIVLLALLTLGIVLWCLRVRAHFLGDGMLWVMRLREGSVPAPAEPLSEAVWEWASAGLRRMAAPVASLGLVSVACGIAASALLWRIAGEIGRNVERLVAFLLLATMGTSQLFFGYVESYPVAVVALLAYLAMGLRAARDRRAPVLLVVLYAVAVASHLMALYLAPSFLYLVLRGERSVPGRVWRLGGALLLSILLLLALGSRPVSWIHTFDVATRAARTGAAALDATRPYGILSLDHLVDIVNELWLVLPIPLLLLVSAIVAGKGARGDPRETFLILAAGAGLLGLLLLVLPVAAAQDWDLMAMLLLPLGVLGVAWGRSLYASRTAARIACVSAALGSLLAFVLVNASQASATRRFETIVGPGAKISSFGRWYAWESLAQHYRHLGRYDEAMRYVDGLLRTAPSNPRYWGMAGETLNGFGRYAEAVPFLQESLRRNPNRPTARTNLGIAYSALGRYPEALGEFREAVRLDGDDADYRHNLGLAFWNAGMPDSARATWTALLARWPGYARTRQAMARFFGPR